LALIGAVAVSSLSAARPAAAEAPAAGEGRDPQAAEVRLRKLHLVRPDLIPYPIAFEVYC
jgi:hypothetical protein